MTTSEKLTIIGIIVALLAIFLPLAVGHWYRTRDRGVRLSSKLYPHVYFNRARNIALHGIAVEVTSLGIEPIEIVNMRVRLSGVDVLNSFMQGFSQTRELQKPEGLKPSDCGLEIALRLEHGNTLVTNSEKLKGLQITKNHSARFFTPLPFQPFDLQQLLNFAGDDQISVVANILPEKDKVLLEGKTVMAQIHAALKMCDGKASDPGYPWVVTVFTQSKTPVDTWALGKLNDRPVRLSNRIKPSKIGSRKKKGKSCPDLLTAKWRCEALRDLNLNVLEVIALPQNFGDQFHPQELGLLESEAKELLKDFVDAMKTKSGFQFGLQFVGDQRPLTVTFVVEDTAGYVVFTFEKTDADQLHIHGILALLPRLKPTDDAIVIELIKKYACLQGISHRAFERVTSNIDPIAAMFFADIGSANYPPLYLIMKLLTAAFFTSSDQISFAGK